MLILPDSSKLGDGRNGENLRDAEAIAHLNEKNERDLKRYRWHDQAEITDCFRRIGERMHHSELIRRVTSLNAHIFVEQSINYANSLGFYHQDPQTGERKYLSCFDKGAMPEFSFILCDYQDIPEEEVRGWRTVLVRLLTEKALTWRQVKEEFGDPINDLNANRWYAETKQFRT